MSLPNCLKLNSKNKIKYVYTSSSGREVDPRLGPERNHSLFERGCKKSHNHQQREEANLHKKNKKERNLSQCIAILFENFLLECVSNRSSNSVAIHRNYSTCRSKSKSSNSKMREIGVSQRKSPYVLNWQFVL